MTGRPKRLVPVAVVVTVTVLAALLLARLVSDATLNTVAAVYMAVLATHQLVTERNSRNGRPPAEENASDEN